MTPSPDRIGHRYRSKVGRVVHSFYYKDPRIFQTYPPKIRVTARKRIVENSATAILDVTLPQ